LDSSKLLSSWLDDPLLTPVPYEQTLGMDAMYMRVREECYMPRLGNAVIPPKSLIKPLSLTSPLRIALVLPLNLEAI
jgi:hypothetical protein